MIDTSKFKRHFLLLLAFTITSTPVLSVAADDLVIGFLQIKNDKRYSRKATYAKYLMQPLGRPFIASKVALQEVKFHGTKADVEFKLKKIQGKSTKQLLKKIDLARQDGVEHFIADLPWQELAQLSKKLAQQNLLLYNISAREDTLRQSHCQENLLHIIPSHAMLMDSLAQYLISKKWRNILILSGPSESDAALTQTFERSAKRYGLKIREKKPFVFGNNPRERDKNNISLLTANRDYDIVFVADNTGEFARDVPYQTLRPQLTVGTEGMAALAWHWSWERHGAPQLEKRFEKITKRAMGGFDWAAWQAVKVIAEAVQRTGERELETIREYLRSDDLVIDTFKGNRSNFRPWNNQMRQPVLLATHNWVVERAPLKGFLHKKNNLDSIGLGIEESSCKFR